MRYDDTLKSAIKNVLAYLQKASIDEILPGHLVDSALEDKQMQRLLLDAEDRMLECLKECQDAA